MTTGIGSKSKPQKGLFTKPERVSTKIEFSNETRGTFRTKDKMKTVLLPTVLKRMMSDKRVTVRQLAKDVSIAPSTLSSYLSDRKASYSPEHLESLSSYFNVSVDYLLFGSDRTSGVNSLPTELVYDGWLRVKIERAIPVGTTSRKKGEGKN